MVSSNKFITCIAFFFNNVEIPLTKVTNQLSNVEIPLKLSTSTNEIIMSPSVYCHLSNRRPNFQSQVCSNYLNIWSQYLSPHSEKSYDIFFNSKIFIHLKRAAQCTRLPPCGEGRRTQQKFYSSRVQKFSALVITLSCKSFLVHGTAGKKPAELPSYESFIALFSLSDITPKAQGIQHLQLSKSMLRVKFQHSFIKIQSLSK